MKTKNYRSLVQKVFFLSTVFCVSNVICDSEVSTNELCFPNFNVTRALQQNNIIPVAIIGAGPAGMAAALYTSRAQLPTYIYTGNNAGGYLNEIQHIENYPAQTSTTGAEIANKLQEQIKKFGVHFIEKDVASVDFSKWPYAITTRKDSAPEQTGDEEAPYNPDDYETAYALSVIIATGFEPQKVEIPGADTYWGLGVGMCTLCDGPFHQDQEVVIAGGDDYAAERALQLAAYAKKVTMIVKEPRLTATAIVQDYLHARPNITMLFNSEITNILGDKEKVTDVEVTDSEKKAVQKLPAQGVFVSSNYIPNSEFLRDQLELDDEGYVVLPDAQSQQSSVQGVFAAGTVADKKFRKTITASGDGGKAGMEAIDFMYKKLGFHASDKEKVQNALFCVNQLCREEIESVSTMQELQKVKNNYPVTVVYFYRQYCPHCKEAAGYITKLKEKFCTDKRVQIVKANTQNAQEILNAIKVTEGVKVDGVPYVIIYQKGMLKPVYLRGYAQVKAELHAAVEKLVGGIPGTQSTAAQQPSAPSPAEPARSTQPAPRQPDAQPVQPAQAPLSAK